MGANRGKSVCKKRVATSAECAKSKQGATSQKWVIQVQMAEDALSNDSKWNGKCA